MSAPTASSHQKKQRTSAQHDSSLTICSSRDPTGSAAPAVSPVTSAVLLRPRRSSGNDNFQCCLCLEFHNYENHTNLRPECFHRFCETCYNTEETVRQLNLDKCPACQKDLDETISEVLMSRKVWPRPRRPRERQSEMIDDNDASIIAKSSRRIKKKVANAKQHQVKTIAVSSSSAGRSETKRKSEITFDENKNKERDEEKFVSVVPRLSKKQKTFDEWFAELAAFTAKHGHCNPPWSNEYTPLVQWCYQVRKHYKQIQMGKKPRGVLSHDMIDRLEELGFKWVRHNYVFDSRFTELTAFKARHGHCNPPWSSNEEYIPLVRWCYHLRLYYKQIQMGKTPRGALTYDMIDRLEELGFQWVLNKNS